MRTDHQSLKFLLKQRIATPDQQKWLAKFLGYAFIVEYKIGAESKVANALSRRSDHITMSGQHKEFPKLVVYCFFQFLILLGCIFLEIVILKINLCSNSSHPFKLVQLLMDSLGRIILFSTRANFS